MKIEVTRDVAEWQRETWEVDIPDDTDPEDYQSASIDAMYSGFGEVISTESAGNVEMLDMEYISFNPLRGIQND